MTFKKVTNQICRKNGLILLVTVDWQFGLPPIGSPAAMSLQMLLLHLKSVTNSYQIYCVDTLDFIYFKPIFQQRIKKKLHLFCFEFYEAECKLDIRSEISQTGTHQIGFSVFQTNRRQKDAKHSRFSQICSNSKVPERTQSLSNCLGKVKIVQESDQKCL